MGFLLMYFISSLCRDRLCQTNTRILKLPMEILTNTPESLVICVSLGTETFNNVSHINLQRVARGGASAAVR